MAQKEDLYLELRTPGFHPGNRDSLSDWLAQAGIPLRATTYKALQSFAKPFLINPYGLRPQKSQIRNTLHRNDQISRK